MPNYGDSSYWDKRYKDQKNETFDWLEDFATLKPLIERYATQEGKFLILGCGNSILSEELYLNGYEHIVNIDISQVVIDQMAKRNRHLTEMTWEKMDCRKLKFEDETFDCILDKRLSQGTIDALLCSDEPALNVATMLREAQRVLKGGGFYIAISYGYPQTRMEHLTRKHLAFEITVEKINKRNPQDDDHYVYICKRKVDAHEVMTSAIWQEVKDELFADPEREKFVAFTQKTYGDDKDFEMPSISSDGQGDKSLSELDENYQLGIMTNEDIEKILTDIQEEFEDSEKPPEEENENKPQKTVTQGREEEKKEPTKAKVDPAKKPATSATKPSIGAKPEDKKTQVKPASTSQKPGVSKTDEKKPPAAKQEQSSSSKRPDPGKSADTKSRPPHAVEKSPEKDKKPSGSAATEKKATGK